MTKKKDPRLVTVETYLCRNCIYWGNKESPYVDWKMCDMWNSYTSNRGFCMYSHPRINWEEQDCYFAIYGYKNYIAEDDCGSMASWEYCEKDYLDMAFKKVVKATSEENAIRSVQNCYRDGSGQFAVVVSVKKFDTKKEAENFRLSKDDFLDGIGREHIHD